MRRLIAMIITVAMILVLCSACGSVESQDSAAVPAEQPADLTPITVVLDHYPMADTAFLYMASASPYWMYSALQISSVTPSGIL